MADINRFLDGNVAPHGHLNHPANPQSQQQASRGMKSLFTKQYYYRQEVNKAMFCVYYRTGTGGIYNYLNQYLDSFPVLKNWSTFFWLEPEPKF